MSARKYTSLILLVAALGTAAFVFRPDAGVVEVSVAAAAENKPILLPLSANVLDAVAPNSYGLLEPVSHFKGRITKKTFGMHITPETSPVEHDRFSGYHTGVDAEYTDTSGDIPVSAISGGVVVVSTWATGYGGVIVVHHSRTDIPPFSLYGHLNPATLLPVGSRVTAGEQLGILGDDHSEQTDGVRKHLHFSLYTGEKFDMRGYVPGTEDLTNWADPLDFF